MPSTPVGGVAVRWTALSWSPCVRSVTQLPLACTCSPALMTAQWPTTVTSSRRPRTFTRSTAKPFSGLWYVTRSTKPLTCSVATPGSAARLLNALPSRPLLCRLRLLDHLLLARPHLVVEPSPREELG